MKTLDFFFQGQVEVSFSWLQAFSVFTEDNYLPLNSVETLREMHKNSSLRTVLWRPLLAVETEITLLLMNKDS